MATSVQDLLTHAQRHAWDLAFNLPIHTTRPADWDRNRKAYLTGWATLSDALTRSLDGTVYLHSTKVPSGQHRAHPDVERVAELLGAAHDLVDMSELSDLDRTAYRDTVAGIGETVARVVRAHMDRTSAGRRNDPQHAYVLDHAIRALRESTTTHPASRVAALPARPVFAPDDMSLGATVARWQQGLGDSRGLQRATLTPRALQSVAVDSALLLRLMRDNGATPPLSGSHLRVLSHAWVAAARSWGPAAAAPSSAALHSPSEENLIARAVRESRAPLHRDDTAQVISSLTVAGRLYRDLAREAVLTRAVHLPAAMVMGQPGPVLPSTRAAAARRAWVPITAAHPVAREALAAAARVAPLTERLHEAVAGARRASLKPARPGGPSHLYGIASQHSGPQL